MAISPGTLEHVNLTVRDLPRMLRFVRAALPGWELRGEGLMDFNGRATRWLHVGTAEQYLALQDGGTTDAPDWRGSQAGTQHIGLAVDSLDALLARLSVAGFEPDHWGETHPHRRRVYVMAPDGIQFEFIEYLSQDAAERNAYVA